VPGGSYLQNLKRAWKGIPSIFDHVCSICVPRQHFDNVGNLLIAYLLKHCVKYTMLVTSLTALKGIVVWVGGHAQNLLT